MKTKIKLMIGISLIALFFLPAFTNYASAKSDEISLKEGQDAITISTNFITLKLVDGKPHFIWWYGNQSTSDEMYNVQFTKIHEYFGADDTLDNCGELGGKSYNLVTSNWASEIVEDDTSVTVTLTLSGLVNDAELQFIIHVYEANQPVEGTDQIIDALAEVKFDIVVKDWVFSEGAAGLAVKSQVLESQLRNTVRIRNGTVAENGNTTRTMQFESGEYGNKKVAFYEWAIFADVYDGASKISTIDVGEAYLDECAQGEGPGIPGMIHFWLTYPNYGDSYTLKHDPSIGIFPDAFIVPLYLFSIISGIIATVAIVTIVRKRKT
ncbi:MAG: hypothetical protein GNW80_11145 [Asgard group archaeon]|nr:hypothetical protein [Asgard group archaeon]